MWRIVHLQTWSTLTTSISGLSCEKKLVIHVCRKLCVKFECSIVKGCREIMLRECQFKNLVTWSWPRSFQKLPTNLCFRMLRGSCVPNLVKIGQWGSKALKSGWAQEVLEMEVPQRAPEARYIQIICSCQMLYYTGLLPRPSSISSCPLPLKTLRNCANPMTQHVATLLRSIQNWGTLFSTDAERRTVTLTPDGFTFCGQTISDISYHVFNELLLFVSLKVKSACDNVQPMTIFTTADVYDDSTDCDAK